MSKKIQLQRPFIYIWREYEENNKSQTRIISKLVLGGVTLLTWKTVINFPPKIV